MKNLFKRTIELVQVVLIVFFLGLLIPILISTIVVLNTKATFGEIISESVIFWIFTIIGWILAAIFVDMCFDEERF